MLIDDITIRAFTGDGGDGIVAFDKRKMMQGPTGGNGGHGGGIYVEGVTDIGALQHYRHQKEWKAENGKNGGQLCMEGANGKDLVLKVPIGTIVHNLTTGVDYEITKTGESERVLIAEGGSGGRGNFSYRSSRNTSPRQFQNGMPGREFELRVELKLIADVGFIGFPNVGKSSLLNELTRAKSKVANYRFTTLEPSLGVYYNLILADIPGLIEGASEGKGLGHKFLRHVERTKILFHLVCAESPDPAKDYIAIREELAKHNEKLLDKPEYVFLNKVDLISESEAKGKLKEIKEAIKNSPNTKLVAPLSVYDECTLAQVRKILNSLEKEK